MEEIGGIEEIEEIEKIGKMGKHWAKLEVAHHNTS